jgi:hypothetical protein
LEKSQPEQGVMDPPLKKPDPAIPQSGV